MMSTAEYEARLDAFRLEFALLVDKFVGELGPAAERSAYPDEFIDWCAEHLEDYDRSTVVGWVMVLELHDSMNTRAPGFYRVLTPPMQSPGQTTGMLYSALAQGAMP